VIDRKIVVSSRPELGEESKISTQKGGSSVGSDRSRCLHDTSNLDKHHQNPTKSHIDVKIFGTKYRTFEMTLYGHPAAAAALLD
jgi:hypothetical protein